jgi:hypothetical protein
MDRNVERGCQMGEDKLAVVATYHVLFPKIAFLGRERALVIGSKGLRIGTKFGAGIRRRSGKVPGIRAGRRGRTQLAGERFFKSSLAVVRRHDFLLP